MVFLIIAACIRYLVVNKKDFMLPKLLDSWDFCWPYHYGFLDFKSLAVNGLPLGNLLNGMVLNLPEGL